MILFNNDFRHTPPGLLEDLVNLQKEGAVYGEFWFDDIQEFRSCRIPFAPTEIAAYLEAAVAYDEFLGHWKELGDPRVALDRLSSAHFRIRVQAYNKLMESRGADQNYCFAGFMGGELEDLVCGGRPDRYEYHFQWPSTDVAPGIADANRGPGFPCPDVGLLKFVGYSVGENGLSDRHRQGILRKVFSETIPEVDSPEYTAQWGAPGSWQRLRKLADSIASFVRNAKRRKNPPQGAIRDWENDLRWLKDTFYRGSFDWPSP